MIVFGPLAECQARELVKVKIGRGTEWAIVGERSRGYFPLILPTGENAPLVSNAGPEPSDLATYQLAKYGTKYRFVHDPNGPCQIGDDKLSKSAGSLVFTEDSDWHLVVNNRDRAGDMRWLNLGTGKVQGEPGSRRIAFGKWDLFIEGLKPAPSETTLLSQDEAGIRAVEGE